MLHDMEDLKQLIHEYNDFYTQMSGCFIAVKAEPSLKEKDYYLGVFYTEGWDYTYGEDGNFYILGVRNKEIEELLDKYIDEASEERERYNEIKLKVWRLLPDFYHYHIPPFKYYEPPEAYDPDKPFEV